MESTNPVNWFEIPVYDLDRARKFYAHFRDSEGNRVALHAKK